MQVGNVVTLSMWDNSPGIRLPQFIIEMLALKVEDKLNCGIDKGKIVLSPIHKKNYTLNALLDNVVDQSEEISWGAAEGNEIW
ncbi:transcriptional regulator/antitoxin MazE [Candidatus Magnetomorum sp. HK-1]|nr:transcriptional regulator/antitoxin MazE [Candidatus Magnetomorum sp. HK-1]